MLGGPFDEPRSSRSSCSPASSRVYGVPHGRPPRSTRVSDVRDRRDRGRRATGRACTAERPGRAGRGGRPAGRRPDRRVQRHAGSTTGTQLPARDPRQRRPDRRRSSSSATASERDRCTTDTTRQRPARRRRQRRAHRRKVGFLGVAPPTERRRPAGPSATSLDARWADGTGRRVSALGTLPVQGLARGQAAVRARAARPERPDQRRRRRPDRRRDRRRSDVPRRRDKVVSLLIAARRR